MEAATAGRSWIWIKHRLTRHRGFSSGGFRLRIRHSLFVQEWRKISAAYGRSDACSMRSDRRHRPMAITPSTADRLDRWRRRKISRRAEVAGRLLSVLQTDHADGVAAGSQAGMAYIAGIIRGTPGCRGATNVPAQARKRHRCPVILARRSANVPAVVDRTANLPPRILRGTQIAGHVSPDLSCRAGMAQLARLRNQAGANIGRGCKRVAGILRTCLRARMECKLLPWVGTGCRIENRDEVLAAEAPGRSDRDSAA